MANGKYIKETIESLIKGNHYLIQKGEVNNFQ